MYLFAYCNCFNYNTSNFKAKRSSPFASNISLSFAHTALDLALKIAKPLSDLTILSCFFL